MITSIGQNNGKIDSGGGNHSSISISQTISGNNTILFFCVFVDRFASGGISGTTCTATYNGVSMTAIGTVNNGSNFKAFLFYILNPTPSGSAVATYNQGVQQSIAFTNLFAGANQSGQPEVFNTASLSYPGGTPSEVVSVNLAGVVNTDDWVMCYMITDNQYGSISSAPGFNLTGINNSLNMQAGSACNDTNGVPGTLVASMTWTNNGYPSVDGFSGLILGVAFTRSANSFSPTASMAMMNSANRFSDNPEAGSVPTNPPILTIRQKTTPFSLISIFNYIKSSLLGTILPVLNNEQSDPIYFRIYNNFQGGQKVKDAINIEITTWDGNSMTASMAVASYQWMHLMQTGFGEGSSGGALYTQYPGLDRAIGGPTNESALDYASNGTPNVSEIRSASVFPGAGFAELKTYISPKTGSVGQLNNFVVSVYYEYI